MQCNYSSIVQSALRSPGNRANDPIFPESSPHRGNRLARSPGWRCWWQAADILAMSGFFLRVAADQWASLEQNCAGNDSHVHWAWQVLWQCIYPCSTMLNQSSLTSQSPQSDQQSPTSQFALSQVYKNATMTDSYLCENMLRIREQEQNKLCLEPAATLTLLHFFWIKGRECSHGTGQYLICKSGIEFVIIHGVKFLQQ